MRVEMRAQISGTRNGEDWPAPGVLIDVPEVEAADLIRSGLAVESAALDTTPVKRGPGRPRKDA